MAVRMIAGLGNPGSAYQNTRHNTGFMRVDNLAARAGVQWTFEKRFEAFIAKVEIANHRVLLVKPWTFMNNSGQSLSLLCAYYRIAEGELVVIYDDMTLSLGQMKIAISGNSGGHNGVASILRHLDIGFIRFKIGIGPKSLPQISLADHVLGKLSPLEYDSIEARRDDFFQGIELLVDKGTITAMNLINKRLKK